MRVHCRGMNNRYCALLPQHGLGHGVAEGRAVGQTVRQRVRFLEQLVGLDEAVVEAEALGLLAAETGVSHRISFHHQGALAVQEAYGDKVEIQWQESVPEGADAERVLTQMALGGCKIIFTTSFGYMEQTLKAAKSFPKVEFYHNTGFKTAPNVHTYNSRMYEPAYLAGIIAGRMTKSNVLGYVASFPIPEVVRNIGASVRTLTLRARVPRILAASALARCTARRTASELAAPRGASITASTVSSGRMRSPVSSTIGSSVTS